MLTLGDKGRGGGGGVRQILTLHKDLACIYHQVGHFTKNLFQCVIFCSCCFISWEKRPVLKRAWQGLSNEGGIELVESWGHDGKVMFPCHDIIT